MNANLYGLVRIQIDPAFPWIQDWKNALGNVLDLQEKQEGKTKVTLQVLYDKKISFNHLRKLEEDLYIGKESIYDARYQVLLSRSLNGGVVITTSSASLEWMIWALQLCLLEAGCSFLHGAALEKNGKAVLFPSWGGVGKTALVTGYIKRWGYKLLGDDLVIVSPDGQVFAFPKPMVLYAYHKNVFPNVFQSGKGPISPTSMNSILTKLGSSIKPILRKTGLLQIARKYNPQSVRINPSEVFGNANIGYKAELAGVVWLDRVKDLLQAETFPTEELLSSRIFGSTLNEFDTWCVRVTHVAMGLGFIQHERFYSTWSQVFDQSLKSVPQRILYIPSSLPVSEVPDAVHELIGEELWN